MKRAAGILNGVARDDGDPGWLLRSGFRRKLLEVLFDGKPEADGQLAANSWSGSPIALDQAAAALSS